MENLIEITVLTIVTIVPIGLAAIYRITKNKKQQLKMITESEVLDILGEELPEINCELEKLPNSSNVYKAMECFVDYTKQVISKGNLNEVKHCFSVAEKILDHGNYSVKNAIENVYVYSLGTVVELSALQTDKLKNIFNGTLKKEYYKQMIASDI